MKSRLKYAGLGAALATAATGLQAEVKINDTFSVSGYAVAAGTMTDPDSGKNNYTLADSGASNLDSAKFAVTGAKDAISGKVSLFYVPQAPSSVGTAGILDAYATYTAGDVSVTAGKYLSYLGYEAFDPINMAQLTYATTIFAIPAYHTGAKVDYTGEGFSLGFSATDSLFPGDGFFQGDGEVSGNGVRCLAAYAVSRLSVTRQHTVATPVGPRPVEVEDLGGRFRVATDLGPGVVHDLDLGALAIEERGDAVVLDLGGREIALAGTADPAGTLGYVRRPRP